MLPKLVTVFWLPSAIDTPAPGGPPKTVPSRIVIVTLAAPEAETSYARAAGGNIAGIFDLDAGIAAGAIGATGGACGNAVDSGIDVARVVDGDADIAAGTVGVAAG